MQLLVRVVDKVNRDNPKLDAQLTKAGDVIAWKRDGEEWGIEEIKNPEWRIISVPDMTEDQAEALVQSEMSKDGSTMLRKRFVKLDVPQLDSLAAGKISADQTAKVAEINALQADVKNATKTDADLKAYIQSAPADCTLAAADVMAAATEKPPLTDTSVIGPGDNVIG